MKQNRVHSQNKLSAVSSLSQKELLDYPIVKTRTYIINKKDEYTSPSIGLLKKWTIKLSTTIEDKGRYRRFNELFQKYPVMLKINDQHINIPRKDSFVIDSKEIRDYIRNLLPETIDDTSLLNIERFLYIQQLDAISYYKTLDNQEFFNCIFTKNFRIQFYIPPEISSVISISEDVIIEEEYWERFRDLETILKIKNTN